MNTGGFFLSFLLFLFYLIALIFYKSFSKKPVTKKVEDSIEVIFFVVLIITILVITFVWS